MSGTVCILSRELGGELCLGSGEAKADGVGRGVEDHGDLPGLELLPRPQGEQFAFGLWQGAESGRQLWALLVVRRVVRRWSPLTRGEALDKAEVPSGTAPPVGQAAACHSVAPGERGVYRYLVEAAPDREQRVTERVIGLVRRCATTQVPLQGPVDLVGDGLEAAPPLDV
jgi:hypothetical protein